MDTRATTIVAFSLESPAVRGTLDVRVRGDGDRWLVTASIGERSHTALGRSPALALAGALAFGALFTYVAGSPFVLQDIYGASPQLFSVMFACNALGLVAASQANRALLRRFEPAKDLVAALRVQALAAVALLAVVLAGTGAWGIVVLLFVVVASLGLVFPNATALALADHPRVAGSASGLLGVMQFIVGAATAPLVGVGGTDTALPMALTIAVLAVGGVLSATVLASRPEPVRVRGRSRTFSSAP